MQAQMARPRGSSRPHARLGRNPVGGEASVHGIRQVRRHDHIAVVADVVGSVADDLGLALGDAGHRGALVCFCVSTLPPILHELGGLGGM